MTDFLETGVTWLNEQRNAHFVKTVTYRRGQSSVSLAATRGMTKTSIASEDGVEVAGQLDDWIVTASDLILDGEQVWPQEFDEIRETLGAQTFLYIVRKGPDGEAWRYSDSFKQSIRIHSVRSAID